MKIALGSAQFGLDYGINNAKGKISNSEIDNIISYAKSVKIHTIDTAQSYGNSEEVIGNLQLVNDFNIITKISLNKDDNVEKLIIKSLANLQIDKIYGLLLHNFNDFTNNPALLKSLNKEKEKGKIHKYGFSLYNPQELKYLIDNNFHFDIVQIPFSIFDRRFEPYFEILKNKNVEIHVRSVFLQGLIFKTPNTLSNHFKNISHQLMELNNLANMHEISISSIALNFVMNQKLIDKVVIGIDSLQQLKENVNILKESKIVEPFISGLNELKITDENILLPFNWKS
ncbi:MAG: aldo/keto reductase [Flavobacteriaceae bacterium]|nr:aldo/keto reductase [Flavobacteriaceae bacterium]